MTEINKLVRENIRKLSPYSSARNEFEGKGLFLDANENPFGDLNRYPDPYSTDIKKLLSNSKGVAIDNVFIGNGSDEIIDLLFRIFCEPGIDQVLSFSPSYGMYQVCAETNDIGFNEIPLTKSFQINEPTVFESLNKNPYKITFICSPNNPSGNTISSTAIEKILKTSSGLVVLDEAYIDFAEQKSMIYLIEKFPKLIVLQTMSKAWGLAAARIGIAYANSSVIRLLNKVKPPYNVSTLNQEAAVNALQNVAGFNERVSLIKQERERLRTELGTLPSVKKIYPSEANFLLVEFDNADQVYNALISRKIITRNRSNQIKNCLRITVGSVDQNELLIITLKELKYEKSTIYR